MLRICSLLVLFTILTACDKSDVTAATKISNEPAQQIEINGRISEGLRYFIRVNYFAQNNTDSCKHYELFANKQVSDMKSIEHMPVIEDGKHSLKFTLEKLTDSGCNWSPKYVYLCYAHVGHDKSHCNALFSRKALSTIPAYQDHPPLVLDALNLECAADEYHLVSCGQERSSHAFLLGNFEKRFPHETHSVTKINFREASALEISERKKWSEEERDYYEQLGKDSKKYRAESERIAKLAPSRSGPELREMMRLHEILQSKKTKQRETEHRSKSKQRDRQLQIWRNSF